MSASQPIPAEWWFSPVSSDARVHEHMAVVRKYNWRCITWRTWFGPPMDRQEPRPTYVVLVHEVAVESYGQEEESFFRRIPF